MVGLRLRRLRLQHSSLAEHKKRAHTGFRRPPAKKLFMGFRAAVFSSGRPRRRSLKMCGQEQNEVSFTSFHPTKALFESLFTKILEPESCLAPATLDGATPREVAGL